MLRRYVNLANRLLALRVSHSLSTATADLVLLDKRTEMPSEVWGVEMEKHVLPYNSYKLQCDPAQVREERKRMGNYVVVLIRKVLEDAREAGEEAPDQFYPISTYCRVKYHNSYIDFEGLHSVRINRFIQNASEATPPITPSITS